MWCVWCLHGSSRPTEIVSVCCMMIMMPESGHFGSRSGFQPLPVSPQVWVLRPEARCRPSACRCAPPLLPCCLRRARCSCQFRSVHVSSCQYIGLSRISYVLIRISDGRSATIPVITFSPLIQPQHPFSARCHSSARVRPSLLPCGCVWVVPTCQVHGEQLSGCSSGRFGLGGRQ